MSPAEDPRLSVVIPSYRGYDLLKANLPSVLAAANEAEAYELIVVLDDNGSDDSRNLITEMEPKAVILTNKENLGFLESANRGLAAARGEFTALINTDVSMERGALGLMMKRFNKEDLFAVSPAVFDAPGERQNGFANLLEISWGRIKIHRHYEVASPQDDHDYPTLYVSGGTGLFRTDRLKALGGFSSLYAPWYWEDSDLSLRAWRRGWRCLYEPKARFFHRPSQTIGALAGRLRAVKIDQRRNKILFHWAHLAGFNLVLFQLLLFLRFCASWLIGDLNFYRAVLIALAKRGDVKAWKKENCGHFVRGLDEIARIIKNALTLPEVRTRG